MPEQPSIKAGDVVEVTTDRIAYGGEAVARYQGLAVFVPLAAPNERLRVRIVERKKNFARAVVEEILVPSPSRREARCRYFGDCGGCQLQHVEYEEQLAAKSGFVRDALLRIGKLDWQKSIEVRSASEFGYRSRAQIKIERVEANDNAEIRIGFARSNSHSVCDVEECPILTPELESSLKSLRTVLRQSPQAAEALLSGRRLAEVDIAEGDSGVSFEPAISGLPTAKIRRVVCGTALTFSPAVFFQVNPMLLEALVEEAVPSTGGNLAADLYAGVGLFTVQLARKFTRVVGIESDEHAAGFARENLAAGSITNVQFYIGRVESALAEMVQRRGGGLWEPDFVLLDPPRGGAAGSIGHLARLKPARISYVSCDPTTLARDLRELKAAGYELNRVTAFDLFPQTYHVETVAHLSLR